MVRIDLERIESYTIDLTEIEGSGKFKCPRCGVEISPDDNTEDAYVILESVMKGNRLERIILQCNRCKSKIHLTGFHILNKNSVAKGSDAVVKSF